MRGLTRTSMNWHPRIQVILKNRGRDLGHETTKTDSSSLLRFLFRERIRDHLKEIIWLQLECASFCDW